MNITKTRQLSSFLLSQLLLGLPNKPRQYSTYIVITGGWLIFIEKVNGCVIPEREYKREHCCANGKPKLPTTMSPNYVLNSKAHTFWYIINEMEAYYLKAKYV